LLSGYERLRQGLKAMRLVDRSSNTLPDGPALEALARAVGFDTPTDLTSQLERLMHRLRTLYQDIIDHLHKDLPGEIST
jgi:glutamine synthetase adenylyltransferase